MTLRSALRIFVAGHRGMVGSAIVRALEQNNQSGVILTAKRSELDLRDRTAVQRFFKNEKPDHVYLAAATVGGILLNSTRPADFLYDNLLIESNILHQSFLHGVRRLLFLGSSCIYPKFAQQPIIEESLLTGPLEPTNEAYAIAKISGLMMCKAYSIQYGCDFRSLMPTNLYGPNDNFDPASSHVIPGLIGKMVRAKESGQSTLALWGSGQPLREFLHVDDLALAAMHVMQLDAASYARIDWPSYAHLNVGTGSDISIRELAETLREIIGFHGRIDWDLTKPDGTPRKLLDTTRLRSLGWQPQIALRDGLQQTVDWFLRNRTNARR